MNFTQQFFAVLALKRSRMSMCKYITINNCFTQRNSAVFVSALDARGGGVFQRGVCPREASVRGGAPVIL